MPKQMRRERVFDYLDLEQKLPALIEHLQTLLERYGPNVEIVEDCDNDYHLYYLREETDKEEAAREAEAARWAKTREESERIQYLALKAKFEKGT